MAAYLFAHFIGEQKDGEQIYFSVSKDGLFWNDLNKGRPVLYSGIGEKGVRDPFLVRDHRNNRFYLIATDLRIEAGKGWKSAQWEGSRDLIVWESEDLINWSEERAVTVGIEGAGCVWAPEAIYDNEKDAFMVFWASRTTENGENKHRIYCSYTNDFKNFTPAQKYIEREKDVIDTTIIYHEGKYFRISKDETTSRVNVDYSEKLNGNFKNVYSKTLEDLEGVEGPECYLLPDNKTWCLIVDRFAKGLGYLPLITKEPESGIFEVLDDDKFDMGMTKKRHGGVLRITNEEYDRLLNNYGDLKPVLDGLYADPDIAVFNGKYYIYPTTDGYDGWSGKEFYVFFSDDGKHFNRGNKILDFAAGQVPWAVGSAWAPCICKKADKFYFYFCGKKSDGKSAIGVAVSNNPEGPFEAKSTPVVDMDMMEKYGIKMSQTIDPSVYTEGEKTYLLFGNGCGCAIAELTADMMDIMPDTLKNIEGLYDFREAVTVFKKDGLYHFTWSCDDTGSENYHVNYGVSKELYGPVEFKYTILEKDRDRSILGTGHHSITKIPDNNKYIIAYHRFGTPLKKYLDGKKGFNREVCVAEIDFDENGYIKKVEI